MNLNEFRQQYPEYSDMPDMDLAHALHGKYYADIPFSEFATGIDLKTPRTEENRVLDTGIKPNEPGWLSTILRQAAEALQPAEAPPQPQQLEQPIEVPNLPTPAPVMPQTAVPAPVVAPKPAVQAPMQAMQPAPIPSELAPAHLPSQTIPGELAPAHATVPPREINYEDLPTVGGTASQVPYYTISALRGLLGPVLPALKTMGMDTQGALDTAIKYWRDQTNKDSWKIPNAGVRLSYNQEGNLRPEFVRLPDVPLKDIAAETAANIGAVAGPIRAAAGAADLLVNKYLANQARPLFQSIYRGMITGALTGEGQKDKTLENMAAFGLFEIAGKAADIPEAIVNSTTWRRMTIPERGLVLQSLDDTMVRNPAMSEAEILRRYNNPTFINEAIKKRSVSEAEALGREVATPEAPIMAGMEKAAVEPVAQPEATSVPVTTTSGAAVPVIPPALPDGRRFLQPPSAPVEPSLPIQVAPEIGKVEGIPISEAGKLSEKEFKDLKKKYSGGFLEPAEEITNAERLRGDQGQTDVAGQAGAGGQVGGRGDLEQIPQGQPGDEVQRPEIGQAQEIVPPSAREPNITTLRGAIKAMGGINPGNLRGEFKDVSTGTKFLLKKTGEPLDLAEQRLKDDGWLAQNENLVDVLRDPENLRRNKVAGEGATKLAQNMTAQEKQFQKEMDFEPEAPPPGDYAMLNAEDLPEGKKLTIIDDSAHGWDVYQVTEKDPFGITLKDGRTIELKPGDKVQVRKEDLPAKESPPLVLQGERQMTKLQADMRTKGKQLGQAEQGGLEFPAPPTPETLELKGERVGPKEALSAKKKIAEMGIKSFDGFTPQEIEKSIGRPLSEIEVEVKYQRAKDGREVTVKQPADEALKTIDEQIDMVKRVLDCMEK